MKKDKISLNSLINIKNKKSFCQIIQNPRVVSFIQSLILNKYQNFFAGYKKEVDYLVKNIFEQLVYSQKNQINSNKLNQAVTKIIFKLYHNSDESFWFNRMYKKYKSFYKPKNEFNFLKPYLKGQVIMDFGCGKGHLARELSNEGYKVIGVDVINILDEETEKIPFYQMRERSRLPHLPFNVSTSIIKTVLHHTSPSDLPHLLKDLRKYSQRVILIEDIAMGLDKYQSDILKLKIKQPEINKFMALSEKERLNSCILMDFYGNILAQGLLEIHYPFAFRSIDQWVEVFKKYNFRLIKTDIIGFVDYNLHGFFQVVFIFD